MDDYWTNTWGSAPRDLAGAKYYFEGDCDQCNPGGLDSTDLVWVATHSGYSSTATLWAMWDERSFAYSSNMTLGNEADGLRVLMSYSCNSLYSADNKLFARLQAMFNGGMQVMLGSTDFMWFGQDYQYKGKNVADRFIDGQTLRQAWGNGAWGGNNEQLRALYSGTSGTDCNNRRSGMKIDNLANYPRVNSVTNFCWTDYTP